MYTGARALQSANSRALFKARYMANAPMDYVMGNPRGGAAARGNTLMRKVRALVHGKSKDAADVTRQTAAIAATTIACLTSTTDFATAASGTGLLDMDGDSALINHVRIQQRLDNLGVVNLDPTGDGADVLIRTLIVWFKKPLLVASAAGTLPPITEVLVTDDTSSLPVPDTQNAGRFSILYDKTDNVGVNSVAVAATGAYPRINGKNTVTRDFTVKINKSCHFRTAGVSGAPSGHYDSDVTQGQIDNGLLIMYTLHRNSTTNGAVTVTNFTRLNYTG